MTYCRILLPLILGPLFASGLNAQPPAKPAGKKLDLAYVPSEATAVLVAHPHRVLTSAQAKWWPVEIISAYGKKEMGFDPLEIEQVMMIVGAMNQGPAESVGFVLRFQKPLDVERVAKKMVPGGKEGKIEGQRGWGAQHESLLSIVFPNDRTAIVSTKPFLQQLLTAKPGEGPLQKMLAAADDSAGATFFLSLEPIRPMLAGILAMLAQAGAGDEGAGQALQDIVNLPMTIDTLQVAADFKPAGDGFLFDIKLGTRDKGTAENVVGGVKRAFKQAQTMIMEQIYAGVNDENSEELEIKVASMKYVERIADGMLASLNPKATGTEVTMTADLQVGPLQLGYLGSTFTGMFFQSRAFEAQFEEPVEGQDNLKQIGLAMHNYVDVHKTFPATASYDKQGKPLLSWRVHILPFVEGGEALYKEFHLDEPWDSEHNKKLIEKMPEVFKHARLDDAGKTVYLAPFGKGAAFEGKEGRKVQHFTDGLSKTILVIEVAAEKAAPWTKPEDWEFDPEKEVDTADFGGLWDGGMFNVLFADGHVEIYPPGFDPGTLKKLFTRAAGEVVEAAAAPIPIPAPAAPAIPAN
jgi:prepilin-type processing-associated H-X9-DG protein